MNSPPRLPGDIPLMSIVYLYNFWKVLGFIDTEGGEIIDPGDPCSSRFPENYSNFYIHSVVLPLVLVRYFNTCDKIDNHNRM